jgi:FtsZ-interacting cell division protein ZipA
MEPIVIIVAAIVVVAAVVAAFYAWSRSRRTQELSSRFGPEYRRAVEETGDRREAEQELAARQARVERMEIRSLPPEERERYAAEWRSVQARFVDDPSGSISLADRLVQEVMRARGFDIDADFDQRAADVSVHHAQAVSDYRTAHDIAERHAAGGVPTEELRQAMVHYRAVFDDLLQVETREPATAGARS